MTTRSKVQAAVSVHDTTPELIWHIELAPEFTAIRATSAKDFDLAVEGWLPGFAQWANAA